jgi:hypothetical protein
VIGKGVWRVLLPDEVHYWKKLKERARPAVEEADWDSIWL